MTTKTLESPTVSLTCDRARTPTHGPAICVVTITNVGKAPQFLNRRMLVSYVDNFARDIYFEILKNERPYIGSDTFATMSRPLPLSAEQYQLVRFNESLTTKVALDEYYRFPLGTYRIRAVYAPQPSKSEPRAWSGTARSNEIVLKVR